MILGRQSSESTQYGRQDFTVEPIEGLELADQLHDAVKYIRGTYQAAELPELGDDEALSDSIPADPNVKNYSYTVVDGEVYYRQNSLMSRPALNATASERVKGLVGLRDCLHHLIDLQMDAMTPDSAIRQAQAELNTLYDSFTAKYGLINSRANALAFQDDSSYYLLCTLEELDEEKQLKRKADIFTKRTIKPHEVVTSVDTPSEALALSISEKACVDLPYMTQLTGMDESALIDGLQGVIFHDPVKNEWQTADEYLSGNVRQKLREAEQAASADPAYLPNVEALRSSQPKDLDASEIEVRLGATWIDQKYIQQFMEETFEPPYYLRRSIQVHFSPFTAEWSISGKSQPSYNDVNAYMTYGTERAKLNGFRCIDDLLGQRTACRADFQVAEETDIDVIGRLHRVHGLDDLLTFHDILLGKRAVKDIGEDVQRFRPLQISRRIADDKKAGRCRRERGCQDGSCIQAFIQCKFCRIGFHDFSCIRENNRHRRCYRTPQAKRIWLYPQPRLN